MGKALAKRLEALERRHETTDKQPAWSVVIVDANGSPLNPVADGVTLRILIPDNGRGDATITERKRTANDRRPTV